MTTAAETIAAWATTLTVEDVPPDVLEHAKLHALDVLGCGLAAHARGPRRRRAARRWPSSAASRRRR